MVMIILTVVASINRALALLGPRNENSRLVSYFAGGDAQGTHVLGNVVLCIRDLAHASGSKLGPNKEPTKDVTAIDATYEIATCDCAVLRGNTMSTIRGHMREE
jgi:hypothetical protein